MNLSPGVVQEVATYVDKSGWGPGPWQNEPDKISWTDPATGLPCLIVRGNAGALCGYVAVTKEHPLFHVDYGDIDVDVHGDLTYSAPCQEDREHGVCHTPKPGEPDDVWWIGFDCAHAFDVLPRLTSFDVWNEHGTYRDVVYVVDQVTHLAQQIAQQAWPVTS